MELYEALIPGFVKAFGEKRPGEISLEEQLNGVYMDLNRILSQLYGFPGTGEKLFLTALQSPADRTGTPPWKSSPSGKTWDTSSVGRSGTGWKSSCSRKETRT